VEEELLMSADAKRRLEKLVIKKGGFRTMGQKLDPQEGLDKDTLRTLLLKDGEVYRHSGGGRVLSQEDLDVLCDRYVFSLRDLQDALLTTCLGVTKRTPGLPGAPAMRMASKLSTLLQMVLLRSKQPERMEEWLCTICIPFICYFSGYDRREFYVVSVYNSLKLAFSSGRVLLNLVGS
jgi:hypothetical protein